MARGTTLRNFRCDDDRWSRFLQACALAETDASSKLREMIDEFLFEVDVCRHGSFVEFCGLCADEEDAK